jgi:dienelactone hydrolase
MASGLAAFFPAEFSDRSPSRRFHTMRRVPGHASTGDDMHAANETYRDGSTEFEGYLAFDGAKDKRRPGVLVFHQWSGCSAFEQEKAEWLAGLGYAALAVDMYGTGKRGTNPAENGALMTPLVNDRAELRKRAEAALRHLKSLPMVDGDRIGAIGFCFGGLCVLDVARAAMPGVRGVVSLHGLLGAPDAAKLPSAAQITARVLALHGWNDPMARPDSVLAFAREMHDHGAEWQLHAFGGCGHAFTNPGAQDAKGGMQYSPLADARSFAIVKEHLAEVFGPAWATKVTNCPWPS